MGSEPEVEQGGGIGIGVVAFGKADHQNKEFALAPGKYQQFTKDGLFVVGESDASRDWPYVQPGPSDAWAGLRIHTLDAPLIQLGGLTATLLNSQTNLDIWRSKIERTKKIYSWAMNNHWGTNYRAYQEGPTIFRFVLRPHRKADAAEASRFAGW